MKKIASVILIVAGIGLVLFFGLRKETKRQDLRSRDRQFHVARHRDFWAEVVRRDRVSDPVDYSTKQQETGPRYEQSRGGEQVIWGKLVAAAEQRLTPPLRMDIRSTGPDA